MTVLSTCVTLGLLVLSIPKVGTTTCNFPCLILLSWNVTTPSFVPIKQLSKMGFKRRRLNSKASSSRSGASSRQPSSRPQPFARLSSNPPPHSTTALSGPAQHRLSLEPSSSSPRSGPRFQDEDVARASESDAEIQAREDSDDMNEIVMAVDMREKGTIGCSYYVAREEKLYLMQDIKMAGLDIIDTLKIHAQPTLILISTRSDEKLEKYLSREARGIDHSEEASMFSSLFSSCIFALTSCS